VLPKAGAGYSKSSKITSVDLSLAGEGGVGNLGEDGVVLSGNAGDRLLEHGEVGVAGGVGSSFGSVGRKGGVGGSGVAFGVSRKCLLASGPETLLLAAVAAAAAGAALAAVAVEAVGGDAGNGESWGRKKIRRVTIVWSVLAGEEK